MSVRYSFGGDDHIFVEIEEQMSLDAFFKSLSITNSVRESQIGGVTEICPANASYQIKFNPDIIKPRDLLLELKKLEQDAESSKQQLKTRVVDVPVLYNDPWTHETLMRFRERHQDPSGTDLDYAARINGFDSIGSFIEAHAESPWFVTMVGFVAGLPFMYQMVDRDRQIEVPKYLRPRTDTPKLTVGYGGCFSCIYSVRGAGGYQMFGITPMPIYDPDQRISYLREFMVFFHPGDIVKFRPIDRETYDEYLNQVESNAYEPKIKDFDFSLDDFYSDRDQYNRNIGEALN
ncbi:MAG: allophanate hydrolase subunit 1, partial [Gammaproteobacteria bacterium]|nr:allophanate hydrolase subunit 1 [Gammaproteobacteria bacterium]